jgi:hypothetical protein
MLILKNSESIKLSINIHKCNRSLVFYLIFLFHCKELQMNLSFQRKKFFLDLQVFKRYLKDDHFSFS